MTTTSKETKAFYRLVVTDASKTKKVVVWEGHSSHFNPVNGAAASYPAFESDMQKLPIIPKGIGGVLREDDYLLIEAKDDGSTQSQLIATNQALRIPVTKRNRRTGIVSEQILSPSSFTVTTDFAAADMSATYWREIAYVQVPAQEEWKLGHAIAHNSRILIGFGDTVGVA
ncbi:MAG: hypothetical protein M0R74_17680 [Dehalococcoidia bacterium]|nr:hypothetical protein [Dehalococcoidia bacterium]